MTPGRRYRPEDLLRMAWGRRWLLVVPLVLGGAGTGIYSRSLPNIYQSEAVIQVVPQSIPENFARSTVTTQIGQRLTAISQQLLTRSRLESLILELNLYGAERQAGTMQDAVERMQRDIMRPTLTAARGGGTGRAGGAGRQRGGASSFFAVGFASDSPRTAFLVTERLASMFIEENLRQRTGQAEVTDRFLESQLESARAELDQHEKRLADFKRRHASSLPTRVGANSTGMSGTQTQINSLVEKTVLDRERRLMLERQIADLTGLEIVEATARQAAARRRQSSLGSARNTQGSGGNVQRSSGNASASTGGGQGSAGNPRGRQNTGALPVSGDADAGSAAERLERAKHALQALELRLKPDHPDVGIARRQIAELEKLAEEEALQAPLSASGALAAGLSPAELKQQQQLKALREEMEMLDRQITRREDEEKGLRGKLALYQRWNEEAPMRESELEALTRDQATIQNQYQLLLKKKADSKIGTELESRQIAEQFRIVEPAREPQRPSSPDRSRLILTGAFSGLGVGLLLAGLLEYRDRSLKTDEDVVAALSLPVLAMVPTIVTRFDRRRRVRKRHVLMGSAVVIMVLSLAALKFDVFNSWLL